MTIDERRAEMIGVSGCREYALRYLYAAREVRRKWGKRGGFYAIWLQAAWFFRARAKGAGHWERIKQ